jgi:hypothetical protein
MSNELYKERLKQQIELVKKCQNEHKINSCLKCEKIIGCEIRKTYINAVYQSMNKGDSGGFEF